MSNSPYLYVLLITLLLVCLSPPAAKSQTTYTESQKLELLNGASYPDGTTLVRLASFSTSSNCSDPVLYLRLVHTDGSISAIPPINYTFPNFNFCLGRSDTGLDGIWIYGIANNYMLISYFKASDTQTFKDASVWGLLVDWNGAVISDTFLGPAYFPSPGQPVLNPGSVFVNVIPQHGFIFIIDENNSNSLLWKEFNAPDSNGIQLARNNTITQETQHPKIWATAFSTLDGGYAIIGAYNISNSPSTTQIGVSYRAEVTFFRPITNEIDGPFIIYQSTLQNANPDPMRCSAASFGVGYVCFIHTTVAEISNTSVSKEFYESVNFISAGAVLDTKVLNNVTGPASSISVDALPYGGYLEFVTGNTNNSTFFATGNILNDTGDFFGSWPLGTVNFNYAAFPSLLPNNTLLLFYQNNLNSWGYYLTNIYRFYNDTLGLSNRNIDSVFPEIDTSINSTAANTLTIKFNRNISLANANLTIYQQNPNSADGLGDFPRQICSAKTVTCSLSNDDRTISLTVLDSTFNNPGANYYVEIDNDFVQDLQYSEPLPGVQNRSWTFILSSEKEKFAGDASGFLRLTSDGTTYFNGLPSSKQKAWFDELTRELSVAIPMDISRLSTSKLHQNDPSVDRVLIQYTIKATTDEYNRSVQNLLSDLDILVRNKDISSISFYNNTQYLDETYGFVPQVDIWDNYKLEFLILLIAMIVVLTLFAMARIRKKEGNNLAIVQIAAILFDFALDVTFLVRNSHDLPWLYVPWLLFLIIPIAFNCLAGFYIFLREHEHNQAFLAWSNRNIKMVPVFTVLAGADIEGLNVLHSNLAGLHAFSAPLSDTALAWIFWASTLNMFIEDLPQLIIQIFYKNNTVFYTIVPLLTLVTSSLVLTINVFGRVYQINHYRLTGRFQPQYMMPPQDEESRTDRVVEKYIEVDEAVNSQRTEVNNTVVYQTEG